MRDSYSQAAPIQPNLTAVSNILGNEGPIQEGGVQKLKVPDKHVLAMQQ
jgi:hypothetical protein